MKNIAAASAGVNTVSCTLTGQSFTDMVGGEFSGMSTTAPLDSYGTTRFSGQDFSGCSTDCIAPSGDLYTGGGPGTIATCGTGEILVSFTYTEHAATTFSITTPAGFTVEQNTTNPDSESAGIADSTTVAATAGNYSATWHSTVTETNWGALILALTPGGGACGANSNTAACIFLICQ